MKIIIIGYKGFIGRYLFDYFSNSYEVWGCDLTQEGTNTFEVSHKSPDFTEAMKQNNYDYCINCAGSANVAGSFSDPIADFNCNLSTLQSLITSLQKHNPDCKLINISSAAVYGNPQSLPIHINTELAPISPYGIHKELSEYLLRRYFQVFRIGCCSLRIFSAYGNGQKKLLLWDLYNKLVSTHNDAPIFLFGSGTESRDYIHISDIAQQISIVIKRADFQGESYNIANGREEYIVDVASIMRDEMQKINPIRFTGSARAGDPLNWRADISILKDWGYIQKMDIRQGIKEYCDWAKNNIS